jgi:glycosyltransferase involved in cell wall biosynthesis
MHVLFVHRAFPAQFGRLGLELARRFGWKCSFLVEHLSRCPSPSPDMLAELDVQYLPRQPDADSAPPWPRTFGQALGRAQALAEAVRARPGLRPDLVVGHGGLTPTLLLREVLSCPIVDYCEYYFATQRRDLTYRVDLPQVEPAPFFPRCINAATLLNLVACDAAYAPTAWQRDGFPRRFHPKIAVHHDGIDTELYRPRPVPRVLAGREAPASTRVVTFVARGLESMRGFDLFLEVARLIARARPDVLFAVAGGEEAHYGWDRLHAGGVPFKRWAAERGGHDLSRFVFLGQVEPEQLADLLCLSDLHLYLSVPFVPSWSLLDALACGRVVLAGDTAPVRELIEHGRTGLLAPLFDAEALAEAALGVLEAPGEFAALGRAARAAVEARYGLDVAMPALKAFFERVAARAAPTSSPDEQSPQGPR